MILRQERVCVTVVTLESSVTNHVLQDIMARTAHQPAAALMVDCVEVQMVCVSVLMGLLVHNVKLSAQLDFGEQTAPISVIVVSMAMGVT